LATRAASATPSWSAHSSQLIGKFMLSVPRKIARTLKHDRGRTELFLTGPPTGHRDL
jgi:hypothetical protein